MLIRIFVISTKYGYYSPEHEYITKNVRLSDPLKKFDLILSVALDKGNDNLHERLSLITENMSIDDDSFYFEIDEDQMNGFERLLSKEAMFEYYSKKESKDS